MWSRFNRQDLAVISHYLGSLVMLLAVAMLVPLLVSLLMGEWAVACNYVLGIGISLTLGILMKLAKIVPGSIDRKQAIAITGLVWIIGALVAAVPLFLSGHYGSYLDAVFEGVSALTATGITLVQDLDHMSVADNMWRFTMQFLGGQGIVVIALSLGLFIRIGTALYNSEGRSEAIVPNIKNTSRFIWKFASVAVVLGTVVLGSILVGLGVDPIRSLFHGLWITIGAYDTGGFVPTSLNLSYYHSWPFETITMLLMMLGAVNFSLLAQVHRGNWREFLQDIEIRTLGIWITGMVLVFVAALSLGDFLTDYTGLVRRGIFTIVSATTNTGYQLLSTNQMTTLFSSGAFFLLAISMTIGGSSTSTAGGIKALRVGVICKGIALRVKSLLSPRSAQVTTAYNHLGQHQLNPEILSLALIVAALYVISYVIGALLGIACGYGAVDATFESISVASNAGLSSGITTPQAPVVLKLAYILQMWMGRLEFLTLLALFASLLASLLPRRRKRSAPTGSIDVIAGIGKHTGGIFAGLDSSAQIHGKADDDTGDEAAGDGDVASANTNNKRSGNTTPKSIVLLLLVVGLLLAAPSLALAQTPTEAVEQISIAELNSASTELDHKQVLFVGEVVGDTIAADEEKYWIAMTDGQASISVYISAASADSIVNHGSYNHRGSVLEVIGEFNLACDQHDGLSDVHAFSTKLVDPGGVVVRPANLAVLAVGLLLAAVGLCLLCLYSVLKRRRL